MARREFSARVKAYAAERANGHCEGCGIRLRAGGFHYDHDTPDGLGGEPTLANCRVLCLTCHRAKTVGEDVPRMAKADRQRKRIVLGIKPPPVRPMPYGRNSPFKKTFDGRVIRRDAE